METVERRPHVQHTQLVAQRVRNVTRRTSLASQRRWATGRVLLEQRGWSWCGGGEAVVTGATCGMTPPACGGTATAGTGAARRPQLQQTRAQAAELRQWAAEAPARAVQQWAAQRRSWLQAWLALA
jgi:hypothetical protein